MSKVVKRLGRGLDVLVSDVVGAEPEPMVPSVARENAEKSGGITEPVMGPPARARLLELEVEKIVPNASQPRRQMSEEGVAALADSIRRSGVLQPVVARPAGGGYQLIAGERRWRASKLAGLTKIPAIVRDASEEQMLELALIENLQREDLNPIDRARAYQQYCRRFGLTAEQVAARVAEDRTTVANYLRLLELPEDVQAMVAEGKLSMGHARSLAGVAEEERRRELMRMVLMKDVSVRFLEGIVREEKERKASRPEVAGERTRNAPTPHVREVQRRFEEVLKTKVKVVEGRRKGSGRIVIEYHDLDDFDRIAKLVGVSFE